MARPKRGKRRRRKGDWLREYLITGVKPDLADPDLNPFQAIHVCQSDAPELREAWEQSDIMGTWQKPGCRPWAWWLFSAPRLPVGTFPRCHCDGQHPEPRLHLGGPGRPVHEVLCLGPSQNFGIWNWIGDPADPPTFESQYQYLKRHGLLLPDEEDPLPEPQPRPASIMPASDWPHKSLNAPGFKEIEP